MSTPDKCPHCGAAFLFIADGTRFYECGTIGSVQSEYCRERTAHAETRKEHQKYIDAIKLALDSLQSGPAFRADKNGPEDLRLSMIATIASLDSQLTREREKWEKLREWACANFHFDEDPLLEMNRLDAEAKEVGK